MKFLHIVPSAIRGGVEKNCYHFIRATAKSTHMIVVLASDGPMVAEWTTLGVPVKVLHIMRLGVLAFRSALIRKLPPETFTHIIVWTNARMPIVANALNKYKARLFFHIGNPVPRGNRIELQMRVMSTVFPVKNSVQLRPVSGYVQQGLGKSAYYSKFPSRVSMKPVAIPDGGVATVRQVDASADVRIGMIARLDAIKDHKTVIEAFAIVRSTFPNSILHLAGEGECMSALQQQATLMNLGGSVVFHGDVKDVFGLMKQWDLFVYGTTQREGLGGTVPEALAVGLPVVATDLPMIREWDKDGKFVRYCSPSDPGDMATNTIALLNDFPKRKEINTEAPVFVASNYSAERFAANYISDEPLA